MELHILFKCYFIIYLKSKYYNFTKYSSILCFTITKLWVNSRNRLL